MIELLHDIGTEKEARTTGTHAPTLCVLGVGPQQVTHGPIVGYFLFPIQGSDLVQCGY